ncbi:hypothetical protein NGRA_1085 [Nosema granulosis]|uniref:Uncharacterized protein n=1 Tax=Nosema granulosis TaxID=83296 RepID=A0A9P6H054_9MICR|nr:hypothetical protein NGRA_1085 [Nosema granulosis]
MQNIVYVHNDFGNDKIEKIYYDLVFSCASSPVRYSKGQYLNIILTPYVDSLFDIKIDLFCIFKDDSYLFSMSPISLKSDKIQDFTAFKRELVSYLKVYFDIKTKLIRTPRDYLEFYFKHNLVPDYTFSSSSIVKTIDFFEKYAGGGLWTVGICEVGKIADTKILRMLDDALKILVSLPSLEDRTVFFLSSLTFLPLDIILHLANIVVPKDTPKKIYFYYKLSHIMVGRGYNNLGYLYLLQVVMELKKTLDIKMAEYFLEKASSLLRQNNWKPLLQHVTATLELENTKIYGDTIWEIGIRDKKPNGIKEINIYSGNYLFSTKLAGLENIFNTKRDQEAFVDQLRIDIDNYANDNYAFIDNNKEFIDNYAFIENNKEFIDNYAFIENNKEFIGNNNLLLTEIKCDLIDPQNSYETLKIPIYKKIKVGKNTIPVYFNIQKDVSCSIIVKELVFKHHQSFFPPPVLFRYIPRKYKLIINESFCDFNYEIFRLDITNGDRIFSENIEKHGEEILIFFKKNRKKILYHDVNEEYIEKVEL